MDTPVGSSLMILKFLKGICQYVTEDLNPMGKNVGYSKFVL